MQKPMKDRRKMSKYSPEEITTEARRAAREMSLEKMLEHGTTGISEIIKELQDGEFDVFYSAFSAELRRVHREKHEKRGESA